MNKVVPAPVHWPFDVFHILEAVFRACRLPVRCTNRSQKGRAQSKTGFLHLGMNIINSYELAAPCSSSGLEAEAAHNFICQDITVGINQRSQPIRIISLPHLEVGVAGHKLLVRGIQCCDQGIQHVLTVQGREVLHST